MADRNPVQEAIDVLGGRVEDVAVVCRVSGQAVYNWLKKGRIDGGRYAVLIARATMSKGRPISIERLVGLGEDANGPSPTAGNGRRRVTPRTWKGPGRRTDRQPDATQLRLTGTHA